MAWHAIDVIQPAIEKTKSFFSGPGLFKKWVKIGILVFVFSMLSGGGGGIGSNFNYNMPAGSEDSTAITEAFSGLPAWFASIPQQTIDTVVVWVMVGIVVLFILGIILTLLRNMCFFAILESTSTNKVSIISYLKKFYGKALSLTFLEIVLSLIGLPFLLILLLAGISFFLFILKIDPGVLGSLAGLASNTLLMALLVLISIVALIVLAIVNYVLGQFAAYWMYLSKMQAWEALKKSLSLAKQNLLQVALLIVMQIVLGIAAGIISFVAALIILIPFAIVGLLLAVVLIPLVMLSPAILIPVILLLILYLLV